jgi:hypothetical protein
VIVLQHNPPPVIACLLRFFFSHLKTDGIVMFQVPVRIKDYKFTVDEYFTDMYKKRGLGMHMLPQNVILKLAHEYNCYPLEISNDGCTGNYSRTISQIFVFKKGK